MSVTPPQPHLSPGPPHLFPKAHALFRRELDHLDTLPTKILLLLAAASTALALLCPLLPPAAYGLQLWASLSPAWRDRWASLRVGATYAGWYVAFLLIYTVLDGTHVWVIPTLTHLFQLFWQQHLPGTLSLSPLDVRSILPRSLLLLPLAPAISLFYERMDPHVTAHLNRILTPADLVRPNGAPPSPAAAMAAQTKPVPKKRKKPLANSSRAAHKAHSQHGFEGLTVPPQTQQQAPTTESQTPEITSTQPEQPGPAPSSKTTINWDEVVE